MYLNEKIYREGNDKVEWKKSYWSSPVNYVGQLVVGYSIFVFRCRICIRDPFLMTKLQVKERPKLSCDVWTSNSQIVCESAQTRLHIKSPPCLFIKKLVLSLARPNFLTGAKLGRSYKLGSRPRCQPPLGLNIDNNYL